MHLEYFISHRLITSKDNKSSIVAPIIKISISAIAIGLIMMIVSVATGVGLQEKIKEKIAAFSGHIIITNYDENQSIVNTVPISLNQSFYPKFKNIDHISHIQAVASKGGIIRTSNAFEGVIFKGVGKDYNFKLFREYLISGKVPNLNGEIKNEVLISKYLCDRLNLKLNDSFNAFFIKVGKNNLPNLRVFKIVGIYNSGFQEFDSSFIICDIRHVQKLNHWQKDQVGNFEVFIDNFNEINQKGNEIYKQIPPTLNSKTIIEKYSNIFEWLKLFDFNILTIIVIMIIVSTINIVVAILVMILERTQMIGILKSLGASNWSIRKIFIYHAAHLIIRGLFWGNFIGIGLILIQKYGKIIKLPPENYYVTVAPVSLNLGHILLLNLATAIVCLLVIIFPSYIITKIQPIKAIRFD